ncbi:MAG: cbb3-type cytochrome c oxidase subunit I, partial [Minisyncoccia bacterium]
FTLGGVAGVVMAEPPADYQLHNSLFLVAHFHTMIVSGVLFGYFAGLTYWFPKIFGFTLDESLGRKAVWLWIVGFILAFGPLYILGLEGATRRLDHYPSGLGWQPLFILAGVGAVLITLGFVAQIAQIARSIRNRNANRVGADPWDGRTLEWSVPSPAPEYNFAQLPIVSARDELWARKQGAPAHAEEETTIEMPKNTAAGLVIAVFAFCLGFGAVWHIWWLAALALLGLAGAALMRGFRDTGEEMIAQPL